MNIILETNNNNNVYNEWVYFICDAEYNSPLSDIVYNHIIYGAGSRDSFGNETASIDVCYLDAPDPNNFIPYANVTPEILKNWLFQKVDQTVIENNNAMVLGS